MLKETEDIIKRRKFSLSEQQTERHLTGNTTTTTPPFTPPSAIPSLIQMMANDTTHTKELATSSDQTTTPSKMIPKAMTATLLANAAALAVSPRCHATVTASAGLNSSGLPDHYSLRWNNHQNHILRAFDALLKSKALVDVTLVCAETSIHAHKMVLSACSPFFQRVFSETPCKHPVIVLKDFRGWVVQAIVDFMYRGEISVAQERLQTLIQAGESLQIRGLVESSLPRHSPTPAASPDDFSMIDTSLMSSELERCSSFDEESPSMVTSGSKIILPSRLFGQSNSRERKRERERERDCKPDQDQDRDIDRERERGRARETDMESDQEMQNDVGTHSDICTSPMPRRKQARPRRRSGELPHDLSTSKPGTPSPIDCSEEPLKTVIKRELTDNSSDNIQLQTDRELDSGNGNDSSERNSSHEKTNSFNNLSLENSQCRINNLHSLNDEDHNEDDEDNNLHHSSIDDLQNENDDSNDFLATSANLRRKVQSCLSDGPEDLCTTNKDLSEKSGRDSLSDGDAAVKNNNNNITKLNNNNNNRIVLSLKDIRQLNKPPSSSTPNSSVNNSNPFTVGPLHDVHLERAEQCKMDSFEAHLHAAAVAAANGENPFHHMEHQMDLSLAAAAAAANASRDREQNMQMDHRELQQHNAYANSLLSSMGMSPFGTGGPSGQSGRSQDRSAHERLEESMKCLNKDFTPSSPMNMPTHFNPPDGPPHPPSPLPFPGLNLTPPHSK